MRKPWVRSQHHINWLCGTHLFKADTQDVEMERLEVQDQSQLHRVQKEGRLQKSDRSMCNLSSSQDKVTFVLFLFPI